MFSHVMIGSNDIERSKRFYDAVLATLGVGEPLRNIAPSGHARIFYRHDGNTFCVTEPIDGEDATGRHVVEVKHAERAPLAFPLLFEPGKTRELSVRLETGSVALPELVVEGRTEPASKMTPFFQRKSSGQGYFVTREDIEKRAPRILTDMLRSVPGLRISCDFGKCTAQSFQEARRIMGGCPIQYYLDGLPFLGDIDDMTPDQVEGIEIYRGSASVPPEFNRGTAFCGVIAVWSRVPGE